MLASPLLLPEPNPPHEGELPSSENVDVPQLANKSLNSLKPAEKSKSSSVEYEQLQRRIFRLTLMISALAVSISAFFFDIQAASSMLVGSMFGIFYLRLLAKSVGKISQQSRNLGKVQLLVPVLLVLVVSRLPQLELLPALLGFLLYKPSLIVQFLFES